MTSTTPVTSPSGPVTTAPPVFSSDSSVVTGQPGFAKQFQDFQELAQSAAGGRSASPAASTTQAVGIPRQAIATAGVATSAGVRPASGKTGPSASPSRSRASGAAQGDRSTRSVASGVGQDASPPTDPNARIPNVPLVAWLEPAAFGNQVQDPDETAEPAEGGGKSSDGGARASDKLPSPAALPAVSPQPRPPQPPPVSGKFSLVIKDGSESPAAAPEVTARQAGAQAAVAIAHLPLVEAAPMDTGATPPAEPSSTPEKAGQPASGPDARAVNAEAGTPGKAEPAPADLAVAVRVKAPASPAASGQSAPDKELRRVDLAEAPPAAGLRTETSRAGAWVLAEGPARGASQPAAEAPSRPPERLEATPIRAEEAAPKAAAPLKDLSLQVRQSSQESVELRVVEREGELHVAVRTGDADLAHGLRQGLPELVDHLDQGGFRTEAWRPSGVVSAPEPPSQAQSKSSDSRNPDSQSQPGWSQQERGQRDQNQSNRPKWVEELEGNLAGGRQKSTGEFHGFSY